MRNIFGFVSFWAGFITTGVFLAMGAFSYVVLLQVEFWAGSISLARLALPRHIIKEWEEVYSDVPSIRDALEYLRG